MPQDTFVGREYEQQQYREFLSGEETPWILVITGLGGVGKSALLRRLEKQTPPDRGVIYLDFDTDSSLRTDTLKLLEDLAYSAKPLCDMQQFEAFMDTLQKGRDQLEQLQAQVYQVIHANDDDNTRGVQLPLPNSKTEDAVMQKVRYIRAAIQEVQHQARELVTEAFYTLLDTYQQKRLVIMLDTCELLNEPEGWEVGQWVMNELLPTLHIRLYQRCFVVMASRVPPQSEVLDEQDQEHLVLSMLDKPAVDQYLENAGMHDPLLRQYVYEITHGHALCVSIIGTLWQEPEQKPFSGEDVSALQAEFDERASVEFINERILNRLKSPFRELTQYGVLLRNFNLPLLKAVFPKLLPEPEAKSLFDQFIRYPYIESKGNYRYAFHELIREVLAKKTQKDHPEEWKQYHKGALDYYTPGAGISKGAQRAPEWYYHAIAYDETQGISDWKEAIEQARSHGTRNEVGSLLQLAYDKTLSLTPASQAIRAYEQGRYDDDNAQPEKALESYGQALELYWQVGNHPGDEATVLQAIGDVQRSRARQNEALAYYEQALAFFQQVGAHVEQARLLQAIGDVQRLRKDLDAALDSYRQALVLLRQIGNHLQEARVLQCIGDVYRLRDDPDGALESYKQALALLRQIGNRPKEEEAKLLRAIGEVQRQHGDKDAALETYKQALVLFRGNAAEEDNVQQAIKEVQQPQSMQNTTQPLQAGGWSAQSSVSQNYQQPSPVYPAYPYAPYEPPLLPPSYDTPAYSSYATTPPIRNTTTPQRRQGFSARIILLGLVLLLVVSSLGIFSLGRTNQTNNANSGATAQIDATATVKANSQATAIASALQDLYAQATSGNPVLNDPLSSPSASNWDGSTNCTFTNGGYHVSEIKQGNFYYCVAQALNFSNFAYQVRMTIATGDSGGIIFRADVASPKFYFFRIGQDGTYELSLYMAAKNLLTEGLSSIIRTGQNQPNLLTVVARGSNLYLYVNKQYLTSVSDNSLTSGQIGVFAVSFHNPTDVAFSNAQVWRL